MKAEQLEQQMVAWARMAGKMALAHFRRGEALGFKAGREAVTEADRLIETRLREEISTVFPADVIVGEEFGGPSRAEIVPTVRVWQVDPIDGTLNFALGLPGFCTSLALMQGDEVLAACVHQPIGDDFFTALRGGGARLNGQPISVSRRARLADAVISAQFRRDGLVVASPLLLQAVFRESLKVRKTGAIALELAWAAAGFIDALVAGFRQPIKLYDVAAGLLLLREAGGQVTDFQGRPYRPEGQTLLAGNGLINAELVALLDRHLGAGRGGESGPD